MATLTQVTLSARAKAELAAARFRCGEEPALLPSLDDRPGALAAVADQLAPAGINVTCACATTAGGGKPQAVLVVANLDEASKALGAK